MTVTFEVTIMSRPRHNRREFLGLTAAAAAGLGLSATPAAQTTAAVAGAEDARDADLVVFNGKVYTVDSRQPTAEAFAVKGGRFLAVGSTADIKGLIGKQTQTRSEERRGGKEGRS